MNIFPTILTDSYEDITHKLFLVEGLCERVQIDLCDGVFGLEKTWLPYEEDSLPHGFNYEFDLMVNDWRKYLTRTLALGVGRVVMHIDHFSENDIDELLETITPTGVSLGLCVSNDYAIETFATHIKEIIPRYSKLFIQVMGIKHIGAQGQPFDEEVLSRIKYLAHECKHIEIQVDGSMNPETIVKVKNAGATTAIVGSYLFKSGDVKKTLEALERSVR